MLSLRGAGFPECALNLRLVISMFRSVSSPYVGLMTSLIGLVGFSEKGYLWEREGLSLAADDSFSKTDKRGL